MPECMNGIFYFILVRFLLQLFQTKKLIKWTLKM